MLKIPAWLDPWWHVDYEVSSRLPVEKATAALMQNTGRLRGRMALDGSVILVRHGGFINQFVNARASVGPVVRVRIGRAPASAWFFALALVLLVVGNLIPLFLAAIFDRSRLLQSTMFLVFAVVIWVIVIAGNYTSGRSEAKDLRHLIDQALGAGT